MMLLLVYTFAAFGLAYIVGHAVISKALREWLWDLDVSPVRWLVMLLECPACFGFWTGLVAGLVDDDALPRGVGVLVAACYTAGTNLILGRLAGIVQEVKD